MAYHIEQAPRREPEQVAARASLLAGLRTGARQQQQQQQRQRQGSPGFFPELLPYHYEEGAAAQNLTAAAPVFVPGGHNRTPPELHGFDYMGSLENQMAALQMSAMHSTANIAASYGATQGQPQHHQQQQQQQQQRRNQQQQQQQQRYQQQHFTDDQINQEAVAQFLRQRQAQQEYEQQRQQLEAMAAQQNRTAQAAAQQRALFAHVQAEYERQVKMAASMQQQQQQRGGLNSAHEQRQAAQASIQANLRNRQAQQLYSELLQEEEQGRLDRRVLGGRDLWQVALDAVNEQHDQQQQQQQQHQSSLEMQEQLRQLQLQQYNVQIQQLQEQARQAVEAQRAANDRDESALNRMQRPSQQQQQGGRERVASHADKSNSWRSRSATPGATPPAEDKESTASNSPRSSRSFNSADDTPRTSEEDVGVTVPGSAVLTVDAGQLAAMKQKQEAKTANRYGNIGRGLAPSASMSVLPSVNGGAQVPSKPTPRAFSLTAAPRNRGDGNGAAAAMKQATRQPRGPPMEFEAVNFASRKNARTRKEALSKLRACSSPRMVTSPVIA